MAAFYNELDEYAAAWTRNLIEAGHVAPGVVDERSIVDLKPEDLAGFEQCHFFSGISVWSHALRRAGVPDDFPLFTGSCPCQPISMAGRKKGFKDARDLWPVWFALIKACRPPLVLGEQVSSGELALKWMDRTKADLESIGYEFGAADLCAAIVGAPHIRQRFYFAAVLRNHDLPKKTHRRPASKASDREGFDSLQTRLEGADDAGRLRAAGDPRDSDEAPDADQLAIASGERLEGLRLHLRERRSQSRLSETGGGLQS